MSKAWKRYKVLLAAGGMAICMTAGLGMGIHWSRNHMEKEVVQAAEADMTAASPGADENGIIYPVEEAPDEVRLYKEAVIDEEVAKKVCEKYHLDYDTVLDKDITRDMRNYEEALWLLKDIGSAPLLGKAGLGIGIISLEVYINDVYAFDGGEEVIKDACKEYGINPNKAVVSDLTAEQLIEIGENAYETSDHPKN